MRQLYIIILYIIPFLIGGENITVAAEKEEKTTTTDRQSIEQLNFEVQLIKDSLKEVRRDQLNYRIEKDLLKETYESNVKTINIVITIALGVFTIIGLLGVRSINSIKIEFRQELDELRSLRSKYEEKFDEIDTEQKQAKEEFEQIRTTNQEQDKRLNILELQEKVSSLIKSGNYERAMDYLALGLDISPKDEILLSQKMCCLSLLFRFPESIQCGEVILNNYPDKISNVANLAELYLGTKRINEYERIVEKRKEDLSRQFSSYILWYFELLRLYVQGNSEDFIKHIKEKLSTETEKQAGRIKGWEFTEVMTVFKQDEDSPLKELLFKSIDFLKGNIDVEELEAKVKEMKV